MSYDTAVDYTMSALDRMTGIALPALGLLSDAGERES